MLNYPYDELLWKSNQEEVMYIQLEVRKKNKERGETLWKRHISLDCIQIENKK